MARSSDAGRAAGVQHATSRPAWLEKSSTGQRIVLPTDRHELTIGRDPDSDFRLDDIDVSRWHAVLVRTGSAWRIDDSASTNGTYVNGYQITAPTTLHDGDTVRVGNASFTFHQASATSGSHPRVSGSGSSPRSPRKPRNALRGAIIAALVLYVIGLLANSLNTYFERLEDTWLTWLLPNVVGGVVVVIGAIVSHVSASGQQDEHPGSGGQPPLAQPALPRPRATPSISIVLVILLLLGVGALGVTAGVRYAVGYATGREPPVAGRFVGTKQGSAGGVTVTVLRIYETRHFTRVELTALSQSTIPKSLPLGPFCSLSGPGKTLQSDSLRSEWATQLARGVEQPGTITFPRHLSEDAQSATLSFSFGPDQPQVTGIKLKARPP